MNHTQNASQHHLNPRKEPALAMVQEQCIHADMNGAHWDIFKENKSVRHLFRNDKAGSDAD